MKPQLRSVLLSLLTVLCVALGNYAFAGTIFDDGPINGMSNLVLIGGSNGTFGESSSDGFVATNTGAGGQVFYAEWVILGAAPTGVTWAIGPINFSGTFTPAAGFSCRFNNTNNFGFEVWLCGFSISGTSFTAGSTYWLTLTNATDTGETGFDGWDVNDGPATCKNEFGVIVPGGGLDCGVGGESFTITSGSSTTPEPSSILLLGSGILGVAGILRRKINL